ncbi:hypothetical protein BKA93DRAFT_829882 [Sparassis latifolia]
MKTTLSIQFIIVGSGVGAYAAAVALRRVGHRVLVLEPEGDPLFLAGSSRVSPNMSKILFGWGLEDDCRSMAIVSRYVTMDECASPRSLPLLLLALTTIQDLTGNTWGSHQWDEEILKETRGVFLLMHQTDVRNILKRTAISLGASVRRKVSIVDFDLDTADGDLPAVRLATGELLRANVIIGADGRSSMVRELAFEIEDPRKPTGSVIVTVSIPEMMQDPDLRTFLGNYQNESVMQCFCGDGRGVLANPVGGLPEYSMHIVVPDDGVCNGPDGEWIKEVSASRILRAMGPCDRRLQKLVKMSHSRLCTRVLHPFPVEDWVHPDSNVVLIGGAAHPFHAGAVYSRSMAVEDAACLAEIFSHLARTDQIQSFLYAFQEIRQPRCDELRQMEDIIVHTTTMPAAEARDTRDRQVERAVADGKGVMSNLGFDELVALFAYEAEDAANNWWVTWGLLRERLKERELHAHAPQVPVGYSESLVGYNGSLVGYSVDRQYRASMTSVNQQ